MASLWFLRNKFVALGACSLLLPYFLYHSLKRPIGLNLKHLSDMPSVREADIYNETLGFQTVYAIGLPERTDKRDSMTIGSSISGFRLNWIDGVKGKDMVEQAWPAKSAKDRHPGELGCWRSHMDVLQRIVANRVSTALVMEDDSDWDITLKAQLLGFARGALAIQNVTDPTFSPYGDEWHLLWLGNCGILGKENRPYYIIPDDPSVPPKKHVWNFGGPKFTKDPKYNNTRTRFVFHTDSGVCTQAYAITYDGARRMLMALSMLPTGAPIDTLISGLCGGGLNETLLRCMGVYPQIIGGWSAAGQNNRDSDIHRDKLKGGWHNAYSSGIIYSTMLNANRILRGSDTALAQWDDIPIKEMSPDAIRDIPGHVEFISPPASAG